MTDNDTPPESPSAKKYRALDQKGSIIMFANWSGAHWAILILTALLGAERVPYVQQALGSIDTAATLITVAALGLFGVTSGQGLKLFGGPK